MSDFSQYKHSVLVRVISGGSVQFNQSPGGSVWGTWSTISGLSGVNGAVAVSNHYNQIHVAAVKNGDIWYNSKSGSGSWGTWTNLGHYGSATFNGAIAITNSDARVMVAGVSNGNVYNRLKYGATWQAWSQRGGAGTLTGALSIVTRPNGMYHMVALRSDGHIFITCSTNGLNWMGWTDVAWIFGDSLAIDNDAASAAPGCVPGSYPGVAVVAFSNNVAAVMCWEAWCVQPYEWIGGCVGGPAAISDAVNPFSGNIRWLTVLVKHCWDVPEYGRYKVY